MYSYQKVQGQVLSQVAQLPLFEKLLRYSQDFWEISNLTAAEKDIFHARCFGFYKEKTYERVNLFYSNFCLNDGVETINGLQVPTLSDLLGLIDWEWLADGLPGRFHGDYHFENILVSPNEEFVFLDWRQEFAGSMTVGDIYYDFAKLKHGLIINHELIDQNQFQVKWDAQTINFDFLRKQSLVDCEIYFNQWLNDNGYDVRKVNLLTALIFLNIAALHHKPYSMLLYSLGKLLLKKEFLNEIN